MVTISIVDKATVIFSTEILRKLFTWEFLFLQDKITYGLPSTVFLENRGL